MKKVILMSGVSGSGKSTYIQDVILGRIREQGVTSWRSEGHGSLAVVSADDYFVTPEGAYLFESSKIGLAHGACFKTYIECVQAGIDIVVVDNTNTIVAEIAPYMLGAFAYGYEAEIVTLKVEPTSENIVKLSNRNRHGASPNAIAWQVAGMAKRVLMPWWINTDIPVSL